MVQDKIEIESPPGDAAPDSQQASAGKLVKLRRRRQPETVSELVEGINARIHDIEDQLLSMSMNFGDAQKTLRTTLSHLERRQHGLHDEMGELASSLRISTRQQKNLSAALEQHFDRLFEQLKAQLEHDTAGLDTRNRELTEMQRQLQQDLAAQERRQNQNDSRSSARLDSQERHLRALGDDQREHLQALRLLTRDYDQLQSCAAELDQRLGGLDLDLREHRRHNQRMLGRVIAAGAIIAVALVGGVTYLELNPQRAPEQVTLELAGLASSVNGLQVESAGQRQQLADTGTSVAQLTEGLNTLQQDQRQQAGALATLAAQQTREQQQLERRLDDLHFQLRGPGPLETPPVGEPRLPLQDSAWLLAQPGEYYTIQLAGFFRQRHLVNFINLHAAALADEPLFSTRVKLGLRDWHNVYVGTYASLEAAEQALDALPLRLQQGLPYVRSLASVQRVTPSP